MNTSQRGQAIDSVAKILLRGEMSPQTRATIDQTLNEQSAAQSDTAQVDTARLVGLILGSPEFQRQ
jgi:hypothetical protein